MVRETAKQRRDREDAEVSAKIAEEIAEEKAAYPTRLMEALYRASNHTTEIVVGKNLKFVVSYADEWGDKQQIFLPTTVESHLEMWALNELTRVLDRKDVEVAEAKRKAEVRRNAIAKLTDEERVELGIGKY